MITPVENSRFRKFSSLFFFAVFIFAEYFYMDRLDTISPYAIFVFESFLVIMVLATFPKAGFYLKKPTVKTWAFIASFFVFGVATHFIASISGIRVPFDFHATETLLFLLLTGPLLEELVFRGALWRLIESFTKNPWIPGAITTLMFAYGHYQMIGHLPEDVKPFVYYQTGFTFVIGAGFALLRIQNGFLFSLIAHYLFNIGFWIFSLTA